MRTKLINYLVACEAGVPNTEDGLDDSEDEDDEGQYSYEYEYYMAIGEYGTEPLARYSVMRQGGISAAEVKSALTAAVVNGNIGTFDYFFAMAQSHGFKFDAQWLFDRALMGGSSNITERLYSAYKIDLDHYDIVLKDRDHRFLFAAMCGSISLLSAILLCDGQDVNCVVERPALLSGKFTALSHASDPATIRFLMDAKADVNPKGCDTVLRHACKNLRPESVKMLLDAGADVNRRGSYEGAMSALYYVVYTECTKSRVKDKIEVINLLLAAGANTRDCGGGKSVLHLSQLNRSYTYHLDAAFAVLLAHDPGLVHCRDASGATPLLQVLYAEEEPALVKVLLDAKADVNAVDNDGNTALSQLVSVDDTVAFPKSMNIRRTFKLLTDAGIDLTQCVEGKETPLMRLMARSVDCQIGLGLGLEWKSNLWTGIFQDILEAILYRPVEDRACSMHD
jgi:ankyrin repeat protein